MCSRSCIYTRPKFGHYSLQWYHNGRDGVSNHQPHDCLVTRLFMQRSKKASKLRDTGLCVGNSAVTGEFPTQRASNAEKVSIWWRHHVLRCIVSNGARPSAGTVLTEYVDEFIKIICLSMAPYHLYGVNSSIENERRYPENSRGGVLIFEVSFILYRVWWYQHVVTVIKQHRNPHSRLPHRPNLVALGLSVRYATWPLFDWHCS